MDKITKIALIGAGYIAHFHARGLQSIPNVEIVAVVGGRMAKTNDFASKYKIKDAYTDISSIVERQDIQAVIIATPNQFHMPYAIDFLKNGKDVFLEKPMGINAEEGRKITEASEKYNQLVMVGHMWRFDVDTNYIKEVVESEKLGKIFKTKGYGIHENWGPEGWFVDKSLAGGGALADMGVHAIDTVRYILGDPKPLKVYARISTHFGDYDVDDSGLIIITWDNGTESIIESGWWHPHMDGPEASTALFGTKGYGSLFPTFLKMKKGEKSEKIVVNLPKRKEHCDQVIYTRQMSCFVDCIKTRTQPKPGLKEGQIVLDIVDAAYKSSERGEVVNF